MGSVLEPFVCWLVAIRLRESALTQERSTYVGHQEGFKLERLSGSALRIM
jgi:hypothetical protein